MASRETMLGQPSPPWTPDDIDWEYTPFPSNVASVDCTSLDSALLLAAEATPNQVLSITFDCGIDAAGLTINVGEETVDTLQISPTMIGFLIPGEVVAESLKVKLSGAAGEVEFTVSILAGAASPADPKAYLTEVISFQKALAADLSNPLLKEHILALITQTEVDIGALSLENAQKAADVIIANESALGLELNDVCQIQGSTPEQWWTCFEKEARQSIKWAAASGLLAGAGLTFLGTPLAPAGVILSGIGLGGIAYNLGDIADDMLALTLRVIQVIGNDALDIVVNKATDIDSGVPFSLEVEAEYITYSGTTMGEDASMLSAFLQVINEARDLVTRVNDTLGTDIEIYSLDEPAQTQRLSVDPQYVEVNFAPGKSSDISGTFSGTEVTLTSLAADPLPVMLIVKYNFPGVRTVEKTVDVVVQPSCGDSSEFGSVAYWAGCDESRWGVTYAVRGDIEITCYLDTVFTMRTNDTALYQDGCGATREYQWSSTATTITLGGNTSELTFESQDSVLWNFNSGEFIYRTVRLD